MTFQLHRSGCQSGSNTVLFHPKGNEHALFHSVLLGSIKQQTKEEFQKHVGQPKQRNFPNESYTKTWSTRFQELHLNQSLRTNPLTRKHCNLKHFSLAHDSRPTKRGRFTGTEHIKCQWLLLVHKSSVQKCANRKQQGTFERRAQGRKEC